MRQVEKLVEQGLLYDFYGELLTDHQREVYENLVYNDMSLNEIADEYGISKQGVHDLIRRCTAAMEGYEKKLRMIERFRAIKSAAEEIDRVLDTENLSESDKDELRRLSGLIIEELG
ncbi:YlxM family DNA-binding protein [Butyrivibrio sp. MC2013]|uniref:YlxM family DNA-binding protein n=1 Tax=Butyrivibrio sp. MC2013 TaxID=1280686 RepID=UPI00040CFE86|nr:DNA-binding protein [Butyrivibrio sp. MC2013]